jgi:DNA-binding IclR family transcriptional regulator
MIERTGQDDSTQDIDQALLDLLSLLWEARQDTSGKAWSLAKLCKRSGVRMSTLLRQLNALVSAGLVDLVMRDDGTGSAALSAAGHDLCADVLLQPPDAGRASEEFRN